MSSKLFDASFKIGDHESRARPLESMSELMERLKNRRGHAVREVDYLCQQCEAFDKVKLTPGEAVPEAITCYQCKAGRGMTAEQQKAQQRGMLRVEDEEPEEN